MIYYIRDGVGELVGFKYNNEIYYYMKNAQNDIIGLLNSNYQVVANYTYDSWGNILAITDSNNQDIRNDNTHIANINPFRYRSYYYDQETNLYYLNSRYYNPVWGRFLNADTYIAKGNNDLFHNMYSYCDNNPVNAVDPSGHWFMMGVTIVAIVVGTCVAVKRMVDHSNQGKKITVTDWVESVSVGAQAALAVQGIGAMAQSAYDAYSYYSTPTVSSTTTSTPVHGNSLQTTKPAQGYALVERETDRILKFGETTMGFNRYTNKYLDNVVPGGTTMKPLIDGTKYEMHYWQHKMILDYTEAHGTRPPLNKSDW